MPKMKLVEQHQYPKGSKHYDELDKLCFLSKNIYNVSLYYIRKHYFETGKYLGYNKLNSMSNDLFPSDYQALPRKVSQQVQRLVDQDFKSFFSSIRSKNVDHHVGIPHYLDKVSGRQVVEFTNQALSQNKRGIPDGYVKLSGVSFMIKTNIQNVKFARIVPHKNYITIEIGYEVECKEKTKNTNYASIDIGVNNLASLTSNMFSPVIINGKPLKSINQFYNKFIADESSKHENWTRRMYSALRKRNNKIKDYMHKASTFIVNHLVENNVGTLVIGQNKGWKQDTKMHKDDKQTFIQIPFYKFIKMLKYKCSLNGIDVILQEESYTSKSSFLDQDYICTYGVDDDLFNPSGKRIKRGLYRSSDNTLLNADINGSLNILRKYLTKQEAWNEEIFSDCVEVCSTPSVYTVKL